MILRRGAEQRIEAEATTTCDSVTVHLRDEPVAEGMLPVSVLHYVLRTRESVILDDAAAQTTFAEDPYIRQRQTRSILCLPLLNQAKLTGVLYLENNLATKVFAPARIAVLKLLASQAAIALEKNRAAEALREMELELAHANRLETMGQLTASIAHEVNQPIAATVTNAQAALRWLRLDPPDLDEVRQALDRIVRDGVRAGAVVQRIRSLSKKASPHDDRVDINAAAREVIELTRSETMKNGVSVRTELAEGLPLIRGDRVQLQQVIVNLLLNAIEAMSGMKGGTRELLITTGRSEFGRNPRFGGRLRSGAPTGRSGQICSRPSTRPSQAAWAWGCRSAARSSKDTADAYGRAPMRRGALSSNSRCPSSWTLRDCDRRGSRREPH